MGLDFPEVSLIVILDADKESFLHSERSLIQTIGRAACHLHGTAIVCRPHYRRPAQAISETDRRRAKQVAYNESNDIKPQSVVKRIKNTIDTEYDMDAERKSRSWHRPGPSIWQ